MDLQRGLIPPPMSIGPGGMPAALGADDNDIATTNQAAATATVSTFPFTSIVQGSTIDGIVVEIIAAEDHTACNALLS